MTANDQMATRAGPPGETVPFAGQAAVLWLADCNSPDTRRTYQGVLRQFARGVGSETQAITERTVLDYKAHLVTRNLSPRTVRLHLCVLRSFFDWAIQHGFFQGKNPADEVSLPAKPRHLSGVALDVEDLAALLRAARNARDRALLHLLAGAGLRASELVHLSTRDLHFHTRRKEGEPAAVVTVRCGKGGKLRQVEISAPVADDLLHYLAVDGRLPGPESPLFQHLDGSGQGLGYSSIRLIVLDCAGLAGLGHILPHDLRRTYATMALDNGTPLPYLQQQMGHESMMETTQYYRPRFKKTPAFLEAEA